MSPTIKSGVLGYVRVSTSDQADSGAGLEAQRNAIEQECQRRGWQLLRIYQDTASGKSTNGRAELKAALAELAAGRADALVASKLDRVSRSVVDFGQLLESARRGHWSLIVLDLGLDMSTPVGELMANVLVSVAQFERRRIGERTKDALAVRKAQGVPLGRKTIIDPKMEARIVRMRKRGWSYQRIAEKLTSDGVPTPTGGETWIWTTVSKVVQRHGRPSPGSPRVEA